MCTSHNALRTQAILLEYFAKLNLIRVCPVRSKCGNNFSCFVRAESRPGMNAKDVERHIVN